MSLVRVADISNWQGPITPARAACLKQNFGAVIVRLSVESNDLIQQARQQIGELQDFGIPVLGYAWAYFDNDAKAQVDRVLATYDYLKVGAIFVDCEDETHALSPDYNVIWLHRFLEETTAAGYQSGIYSGPYYWSHYLGNDQSFRDYVSWVAAPDGIQNLSGLDALGGARVVGKQYEWHGNECGISPLDINVFDSDFLNGLTGELSVSDKEDLDYLRNWYGLVKGDYMDDLQQQKNIIMWDGDHSQTTWDAINEIQNIVNTIRKG